MTTAEVLQAAQAALIADTELTAWCVDQFGQVATVWLGIDSNQPPAESEYPIVAIATVEQARGGGRGEIGWRLMIGVGVINDELVSDGSARTYTGFLQAETLRELSENALYRVRIPGLTVGLDSEAEASSESYHPLYVSYTTVMISALKSTRRGLP